MGEEQRSAEKDLLKLIENPINIEAQKREMDRARRVPSGRGSILGRLFGGKNSTMDGDFSGHARTTGSTTLLGDRKQVIRILVTVTVLMAGYFVYTAVTESSKTKNSRNLEKFNYVFEGKEVQPAALATTPGKEVQEVKPKAVEPAAEAPKLSSSNDAATRNIFKPWSEQKETAVPMAAEMSTAVNDYRLVGISTGADPKDTYAMIENVKTELTFFLKRGEKLAGMELLDITDNKLVFKENDKSVELR